MIPAADLGKLAKGFMKMEPCGMVGNTRNITEISVPGSNSFGVVRLLAAILVVFSHATTITQGTAVPEPLAILTGHTLGWHAVNVFFCLSGLLIAVSIERTASIIQFLWARFLRLYPALIAVLFFMFAMGAFVSDGASLSLFAFLDMAARTLILFGDSATLPTVFANNSIAEVINSPVWTLRFEVICYLFLAGLFALMAAFKHALPKWLSFRVVCLMVLGACVTHMSYAYDEQTAGFISHIARFIFTFFIGVTVWQWRDVVRPNIFMLIALIVLNGALLFSDVVYAPIQILLGGYLALYIGSLNFGAFARFTDGQDYSYGVYITAYPIQQLVYVMLPEASPLINFGLSIMLALPVSMVFWNLVEKPALKLKSFRIDALIGLLLFGRQKSPTSRLKTQQ